MHLWRSCTALYLALSTKLSCYARSALGLQGNSCQRPSGTIKKEHLAEETSLKYFSLSCAGKQFCFVGVKNPIVTESWMLAIFGA